MPRAAYSTAVSLVQQSVLECVVAIVAVLVVGVGAVYYFRRVPQERPPVGTFNGRDITILLGIIIALPFLYAALPGWALTCFLALTFAAALSIGFGPVLGEGRTWLVIGLLLGANIWTSHYLMGSVVGWQLWWLELDILVAAAAIAVSNLYVQGGMRLQHVVWFGLALAIYDVGSSLVINVTAKLVEDFIGALLFYALFVVASYKAYGAAAARLAFGVMIVFGAGAPSLFPLLHALIDFRNDILVPSQLFFAPAAFVTYLWMKHRYGRERTMAEYRA